MPLQISSFMQNKPNFRKAEMNVTSLITVEYENNSNWILGENKPNQTQSPRSRFYPKNKYCPRKDMPKKPAFLYHDNFSPDFVNPRLKNLCSSMVNFY
jgi:hypothetical protein